MNRVSIAIEVLIDFRYLFSGEFLREFANRMRVWICHYIRVGCFNF